MAVEITNTNRSSSIIRVVDAGSAKIKGHSNILTHFVQLQ